MAEMLFGVGLKPAHYPAIFAGAKQVDWFEAISENYMDSHGRARFHLEKIRADHPVGLHGVSLSLGSADGVSETYLDALAELVQHIDPFLISDHLCFSASGKHYSHDLLPLPMNAEAVATAAANIQRVQERLGRQILVENISTYVRTAADSMSEAEFVRAVVERSGCGLLLDVNNVFVNAFNHGFDAKACIDAMPLAAVQEIHLAGHSPRADYLFDNHVGPVPQAVWDLYVYTLGKVGLVHTLIEWDTDVPPFDVLTAEAEKARLLASPAAKVTA